MSGRGTFEDRNFTFLGTLYMGSQAVHEASGEQKLFQCN